MNYISILFLPSYIFIERLTGNINYSKIFCFSLIGFISLNEIINKKYYLNLDALSENNNVAINVSYISLQYFLYDLKNLFNQPAYFIHHMLSIIGIMYIIIYKQFGVFSLFMYCHEISSIFLTLKYLNIYPILSEPLFYITFILLRLTTLPILTYKISNNRIMFSLLLGDVLLHIFWISKIIKKFIKHKKT